MDDERREFLEARQAGLGSSDIGPVLGIDRFRGPLDVYMEKTRPIEDLEGPTNVHILRGTVLESVFADMYEEQTGRKVRRTPTRVHPDYPWARSNADRIILSTDDYPTGVLELKAPMTFTYRKLVEEGLFPSQIAQIQWEMFVGRYTWGAFAFGNLEIEPPLVTFDVDPDADFIERAMPVLETFWYEHVEARIPPPVEVLPAVEVPVYSGELAASPTLEATLDQLFRTKEVLKAATAVKKELDAKLKAALEAAEANVLSGTPGKAKLIETKPKGTFQHKLLAQHSPLDRDHVERHLRAWGERKEIIAELLAASALDLEPFWKYADAKPQLRTYAAKEKDDE